MHFKVAKRYTEDNVLLKRKKKNKKTTRNFMDGNSGRFQGDPFTEKPLVN